MSAHRVSDEDLARRLQEQEERRLPEAAVFWSRPGREAAFSGRGAEPPPFRSPDVRARNTAIVPPHAVRDPFDYSSPRYRRDVRGVPTEGRSFRVPYTPPDRHTPGISRRFSSFGHDSSSSLRRMEEEILLASPPPRRLMEAERSFAERHDDLALARRMQDLEDRGMGRLNSDRDLVDLEDDDDDDEPSSERGAGDGRVSQNGLLHALPNDFEALAKLISESGTNMNELSDEQLNELLGSNHGKKKSMCSQQMTNRTAPLHNSGALPLPAKVSEGAWLEPSTGLAMKSAPSSPLRPVAVPDKALVARILPPLDEKPTAMVESAPDKQKVKRRGLFGFQVANRSRNNLRDVMQGPPNTDYIVDPAPPAHRPLNEGSGPPAAIPPPSSDHPSPSRPKARSMSPTPRPGVPLPVPPPSTQFSVPPRTASAVGGGIPGAIPPKPAAPGGIPSHSFRGMYRGTNVCAACGLSHGTFLKVLNRKYHPECFRCSSCNGRIDPNDQFKYTTDEQGRMHPHHRECFLCFGVQCCICQEQIAVTPDGRVPFIKHAFFDTELMCVRHADEPLRRCCGCQRLEPYKSPFIDCMDGDRGVCASCCRSVVVDSSDATPLWRSVLSFLEQDLHLPIWAPMRDLPILMVGSESLREQARCHGSHHGTAASSSSTTPLTSGVCLKENSKSIVAIVCLTGLPRILVAGILAHEAIHAWIHGHPKSHRPLPAQVEEGLCQLVAALYLSENRLPPHRNDSLEAEAKLRQYYKFNMERDKSDIYGTGYRRAAAAYSAIGMPALLAHVLECRDFPDL
jgi:Protein DA1/LIM domain